MFTLIGGDGKEYGPVSVEQVREWLAAGRADLNTKAKQAGYEQWKRLGDFDEFAPAPVVAPPVLEDAAVPAQLTTAGRGMRLLAAFLDGLLNFLCTLPTMIAIWRVVLEQASSGRFDPQAMFNLAGENVGKSVPFLAALGVVQAVVLTLRGQSIGKMIVGLRIVRFSTETTADFLHVFVLRSAAPWLIGQIPMLGFLFWMVDVCFIFRDDSRCLHDLMADTKVVKK